MGRKFDLPGAEPNATPSVPFLFEGQPLLARTDEPLAVALLAHGIDIASRSVKYHRPRGAFCLANSCAQCWMRIDDLPNRPACMTPIHPDLRAERQNAFPSADYDMFRASDFGFPHGLDHHRLGTTPFSALNQIIRNTTRQMAGTGTLSEKAPERAPPLEAAAAELVIIGAGPAGLAAARAAAEAGVAPLLIEAAPSLGGQLRGGLFDDMPELAGLADKAANAVAAAGGRVSTDTLAAAIYRENAGWTLVLRVAEPVERLVLARPRALILATGGYEQAPPIAGSDLPGVYGARALARLAFHHRVVPGRELVIIDRGADETGLRLEAKLRALGVAATRLAADPIESIQGRRRVKGVVAGRSIDADLVAVSLPPSPAYELAHQAGVEIAHRPELGGFAAIADAATQETRVSGVYAAGDITGATHARVAAEQGRRAGAAAAVRLSQRRRLRQIHEVAR